MSSKRLRSDAEEDYAVRVRISPEDPDFAPLARRYDLSGAEDVRADRLFAFRDEGAPAAVALRFRIDGALRQVVWARSGVVTERREAPVGMAWTLLGTLTRARDDLGTVMESRFSARAVDGEIMNYYWPG